MKNLHIIVTACLFLAFGTVYGQTDLSKWSVGVFPSMLQYQNTDGSELFKVQPSSWGVDIGAGYRLNSSFLLEGHFMGGHLDFEPNDSSGKTLDTDLFDFDAQIHYRFDNGYILKEDAVVSPFLFAGAGVIRDPGGTGAVIPLGGGINFRIDEVFSMQWRTAYKLTTRDEYNLFQHMLGFVWHLGEAGAEKAPKDSDGDGITDKMDDCPDVPGVASNAGCPEEPKDSDGDGIMDDEDNCPDVKGVASNAGCPEGPKDSDGDGVTDDKDRCPTVFGDASNQGCPTPKDSDGDGIVDDSDDCPNVAGVAANNGCPPKDSDNDGIIDDEDKCPNEAGIAANNGCPEIDEETQEVLDLAIRGIQFETGHDILKTESYAVLDQVVAIMQKHPEYNVSVEGHTDSQGNDEMNLDLSKRRAKTAKDYIVSHGINGSRLTSEGYGETRPIDTNDTAAGRARNRRVEIRIVF